MRLVKRLGNSDGCHDRHDRRDCPFGARIHGPSLSPFLQCSKKTVTTVTTVMPVTIMTVMTVFSTPCTADVR